MPKVVINKNFEMDKQFAKTVKHCFIDTNTDCNTLSKASNTCLSTVYNKINNPEALTLGELRAWVRVLRMSDEQIISFIKG